MEAAREEAAAERAAPAAVECAIPADIPVVGHEAAFPAAAGDTARQAAMEAGPSEAGAVLPDFPETVFPETAFRAAEEARTPLPPAPSVLSVSILWVRPGGPAAAPAAAAGAWGVFCSW